jgi:hypothetical protein
MIQHLYTFMKIEELGKRIPEYGPTYPISGYIDAFHESLAHCKLNGKNIDLRIDGWLLREDALKLYEMAYFCQEAILGLGTYHGLSTYIMAQAAQNSPYEKSITSVDLSLDALAVARKNLRGLNVNLICAKAEEIIKDLETQRNRFALAFVDLSYSYEPVYHVCKEIDAVILSGGFILLHDWNDVRNGKDPDYGVYHAARDGLKQGRWEFNGCYGCTALYRRI